MQYSHLHAEVSDVSRRTSLPLIPAILGLLLHSAAMEDSSLQAKTVPASADNFSLTSGSIAVPFEYYKQHIYISVDLNGVPGPVFMVDSGADRNILSLRTAQKLGLQTGRLRQEQKVGFGDGLIYTAPREYVDARVDSIPIAQTMAVIDLNRFERHFSHTTDGILGVPFFQRFIVKLDFSIHLMTLYPAAHYSYRGLGSRIQLIPASKNFVVVPVVVGGSNGVRHPAQVIIDTGSNATLMLYEDCTRALHLESSLAHAQEAKAYGLNGYYPIKRGSIPYLLIGNAETRNLPVDYIDPNGETHPVRQSVGAIGTGILQGFQSVIFDVPHRRMIFEVRRPPLMPGVVRTETAGP